MEIIIKKFKGFSGSHVFLMENHTRKFIRKINNVKRNYEQLIKLKSFNYEVPEIYQIKDDLLDMEYINGSDMKTYLISNSIESFTEYVINLISRLSKNSIEKNYTEIFNIKLNWLRENNEFDISKKELLNRLPPVLPQSLYHGDLTLDNIIYKDKFYLIDPITSEYDSWAFDLCKLRQDLKCFWCLRNESNNINLKNYFLIIDNILTNKYPIINDNNLLILMLLRIYPYTEKNSIENNFIKMEIQKLWK